MTGTEHVTDVLLQALTARTAWDEPPELGYLCLDDTAGVTLSPLPIPAVVWERAGHPAALAESIATALPTATAAEAGFLAPPPDLFGAYLRTEGWTLPQAHLREHHRRRQAGGTTPRFETLADRIELRMATAVDRHGMAYTVSRDREGHTEAFGVQHGTAGLGGRVPDALAAFLNAVLKKEQS